MDEPFRNWIMDFYKPAIDPWEHNFTFPITAMEDCWKAAIESTKEKRFGCFGHYDDHGEIFFDCAFDFGKNQQQYVCAFRLTEQGKSKTDCPYWREIER